MHIDDLKSFNPGNQGDMFLPLFGLKNKNYFLISLFSCLLLKNVLIILICKQLLVTSTGVAVSTYIYGITCKVNVDTIFSIVANRKRSSTLTNREHGRRHGCSTIKTC